MFKNLNKFLSLCLLILFFLNLNLTFAKDEDLLKGTEFTDGLTLKQLAMQRWFSNLTFLNKKDDRWYGWFYEDGQLGLTSLRYHLAFLGYACAAMAAKTPAYREVGQKQLDDIIQRMIDKRVWDFVKTYWKNSPHFPDPVVYENIMYSGHLAQLIGLYEGLSGDYKYSEEGFDFVWDENTKIHYTFELLVKKFYEQIIENPSGGIPCEPAKIFVYCNNHPQISFLLHDATHGTNYSKVSEKWRSWMEKNMVLPDTVDEVFKVVYMSDTNFLVPLGVAGGDGWGLAWMYPWTNNLDFVKREWKRLKNNRKWKTADARTEFLPVEGWGCGHQEVKEDEHLPPTSMGRMGGVTLGMSSCFVPLIARQVEGKDSEKANKIFLWYEKNFAKWDDFDEDGYKESFYYDTSFEDRIEVNGNLACAMVTSGDSLRNIIKNPNKKDFFEMPYLAQIDYPNVYVRRAEYKDNKLKWTVLRGNPKFRKETKLVCKNISSLSKVTRDGKEYKNYKYKDGVLTIKTSLDKEYDFVVEL